MDPALRRDWGEALAQPADTSRTAELGQLRAAHLRPGTPGFWAEVRGA
ncbi:hypothetical protein ACGFMK_41770 [Amycolatopsis sp. NPDC049252]